MILKNLDQLRAIHALNSAPTIGRAKNDGKSVAKKVPAQILENGLLGALAFALDAGCGYRDVFAALCEHLQDPAFAALGLRATSPETLLRELAGSDADTLRAATAEAMDYLSYLRRFANGDKESNS